MGMNIQEATESPLVWQPQTAEEAWKYKQSYGDDGVYIAGGTLLRTQWEAGTAIPPRHFIDLNSIPGLNEISIGEEGLLIGSQTTLQACRANPLLQRHFPMVIAAVRTIAAPSIRNLATIGGNIVSVVGDSITALLAYDAVLVWYNGVKEQEEDLADWLPEAAKPGNRHDRLLLRLLLPFKAYRKEETPCSSEEGQVNSDTKLFHAYHKIGRRESFTPSLVTVSVSGLLTRTGVIEELQIAVGGGQTIPGRLEEAERAVKGKIVDNAMLAYLYDRIIELYEPREDIFASAAYRKRTAANLIVTELWKAFGGLSEQGG
ncbi:FAD binding domain-containing protein [Paenibacillus alkaliterrae]|uniref:FAD binding domain-containing protein n=1 Tax=Paenibacillus alkaliterrae TaxID=320909 RepID=UPI001F222795|nr:FAD binding domain-containing protein [Paenibacillus alkaliterrae]MCF2937138.1 FAD binding domain-containing protein [Paenibacillus alkaliterrae]